jgi:hypothetical protein
MKNNKALLGFLGGIATELYRYYTPDNKTRKN